MLSYRCRLNQVDLTEAPTTSTPFVAQHIQSKEMGTFQPNRRRNPTPFQAQNISRLTNGHPTPTTTTATPRPSLRSTPLPSNNLPSAPAYPEFTRPPHNFKALGELDKLLNFLLQHRPHVADPLAKDCWAIYKEKYKSNKNTNIPTSVRNPPITPTPAPQPIPDPRPQPDPDPNPVAPLTQQIPEHSSLPLTTHPNASITAPTPSKPPHHFLSSHITRQARLDDQVHKRWRSLVSAQETAAQHVPHDDQQYLIWQATPSRNTPILLDVKGCAMALLDAESKISDLHLKALRFLWCNLIENTCTGAVFNHSVGYPRTHLIYLFAQLVIKSPDREKTRFLVVCPRDAFSQWEMSCDAFQNIDIHHLSMSHWQDNINQWRDRGGVLVSSDYTYINILNQPNTPDKQAALAALCSPGPDICILDEASRTNDNTDEPLLRRVLNRVRTKSRLALTSLPLAGFVTRAWTIVDWACPHLFGTRIEYQWRYVDPIAQGHKRNATLDDAKLAFTKACLLYNKMGEVTFSVDPCARKEALLSKGISLHESTVWINLSREEYAIYRETEVFLKKAIKKKQLSPYIATDLLICAASSVYALRRTLKIWAEANPSYLEPIGLRRTFAGYQESLLHLLRTVDSSLKEGITCTKLQLALYLGRQCLVRRERLVIFASSQELCEEAYRFLHSQLGEAEVYLYDAASVEIRKRSIVRFNTAPDGAILVAPYGPNPHCMEESGWGFVNATRVLFIDSSWHSGACVQAVNRVYNFAQFHSEAHVHYILAKDTVELALSSVLDWTYKHVSSCDSSTLPMTLSGEVDERAFLLAPEVSPFWIREDPPKELSRSAAPNVKRSELGDHVNPSSLDEHDDLILPLQKTENNTNGDKCVHEIILNCNRYRTLSENLDMWMRSEWSRKTRYLRETEDELDRADAVQNYRDALYELGDIVYSVQKCEDNSGEWLARDKVFMEHASDVCHLLNSWEPYRRLYEQSIAITDIPELAEENGNRGQKRPRPDTSGSDSPPRSRRHEDA